MLATDYVSGGELFTHLYQRERFGEHQVRVYIAEIILALEHLHKVRGGQPLSLPISRSLAGGREFSPVKRKALAVA